MKKIMSVFLISVSLTACGGGDNNANVTPADSLKRAADSVQQTGDSSDMNKMMGDTTSASGMQGADSGSNVGGGKMANPQKK